MDILLAAQYAAAAEYGAILHQIMTMRGHLPTMSAFGAAKEILTAKYPSIKFLSSDHLIFLKSSSQGIVNKVDHFCLLTAGGFYDNSWEKSLVEIANKLEVSWSLHEDMEGTIMTPGNLELVKLGPEKIFVAETISKELLLKTGVPADKIIVAGNPMWDGLANYHVSEVRKKIRSSLGINEAGAKFLVYLSDKGKNMITEELEFLRVGLRKARQHYPIYLACYFHPGCPDWKDTPSDENPHGCFAGAVKQLENDGITVFPGRWLNQQGYNQRDIIAAADIFLSWGSTRTVETAFLKIPTIRIATPLKIEQAKRLNRQLEFSSVKLGCQLSVGFEGVADTVIELLSDGSPLKSQLQAKCAEHYTCAGDIGINIVKGIEQMHI